MTNLKFSPLALLLLLISTHSAASPLMCHDIFEQEAGLQSEILDPEYLKILASPTKMSSLETTKILNRAFFPMVEKIKFAADKLTETQIKETMSDVLAKDTFHEGVYVGMFTKGVELNDIPYLDTADYIHRAGISYIQIYSRNIYTSIEQRDSELVRHQKLLSFKPDREKGNTLGPLHPWFSQLMSPVGEYGRKFTEDLMLTTQIITILAEKNLIDVSADLAIKNPHLIGQATARGQALNFNEVKLQQAPLSSTVEGIMSLHQLFNQTLSTKVEGYDSGTAALKAFIFDGRSAEGMTSAIVKRIPLGMVGPMANLGVSFKNSVYRTVDGKMDLTEHFKNTLNRHVKGAEASGFKRKVCPMAFLYQGLINPHKEAKAASDTKTAEPVPKTGLQTLAETYWQVYDVVSKSR